MEEEKEMEDSKKEIKHTLVAKFKEEVSEEEIQEWIKRYTNLVDVVPSVKSFKWGKEMALTNFHQGFTHVFESTFESEEGVAEYLSHPYHVDYAKFFLPKLDKFIVFDFTPTKVTS